MLAWSASPTQCRVPERRPVVGTRPDFQTRVVTGARAGLVVWMVHLGGAPGGSYLAPGLRPPLLAGFHVAAPAQRGRDAGQDLAAKRPQAPVLPAVHALNLPELEAPAAAPGALRGVGGKGRPESLRSGLPFPGSWGAPRSTAKFQAFGQEGKLVLVQASVLPHAPERESLRQSLAMRCWGQETRVWKGEGLKSGRTGGTVQSCHSLVLSPWAVTETLGLR